MLIKVINEQRQNPRNRRDLRRLFLYLFEPQSTDNPESRLLGPPELHNLCTTFRPWGQETYMAAEELTLQFENYCKRATIARPMPDEWFAHVVFAFAPWSSGNIRSPSDPHKTPKRHFSQAKNAVRVAKDALDFLGWGGERPAIFVTHGDKSHIHVHGVFAVVGHDGPDWDINKYSLESNKAELAEVAKLCTEAFSLKHSTARLRRYFKKYGHLPESDH